MIPRIPTLLVGLLAATTLHAAPYTAWQEDYVGNETGTLLLWKFDEEAPRADSSGNGWNISSNANLTTGVFGQPGKFDGGYYADPNVGSGVRAVAVGSSGVFNGSSLSVEFWFAPESSAIPGGYFFDKMYDQQAGVALFLSADGALSFRMGNGKNTQNLLSDVPITWEAGVWQHVAVTYENVDGSGEARIYVNGQQVGAGSYAGFGDLDPGTRIWNVGNRSASNYFPQYGRYDNFRVSEVAYQYAIPEPSTALLLLPVAGMGVILLKRHSKP